MMVFCSNLSLSFQQLFRSQMWVFCSKLSLLSRSFLGSKCGCFAESCHCLSSSLSAPKCGCVQWLFRLQTWVFYSNSLLFLQWVWPIGVFLVAFQAPDVGVFKQPVPVFKQLFRHQTKVFLMCLLSSNVAGFFSNLSLSFQRIFRQQMWLGGSKPFPIFQRLFNPQMWVFLGNPTLFFQQLFRHQSGCFLAACSCFSSGFLGTKLGYCLETHRCFSSGFFQAASMGVF